MNIGFRALFVVWLLVSAAFLIRPIFTHHWRLPLIWWLVVTVAFWAIPVAGWVAARNLGR